MIRTTTFEGNNTTETLLKVILNFQKQQFQTCRLFFMIMLLTTRIQVTTLHMWDKQGIYRQIFRIQSL